MIAVLNLNERHWPETKHFHALVGGLPILRIGVQRTPATRSTECSGPCFADKRRHQGLRTLSCSPTGLRMFFELMCKFQFAMVMCWREVGNPSLEHQWTHGFCMTHCSACGCMRETIYDLPSASAGVFFVGSVFGFSNLWAMQ